MALFEAIGLHKRFGDHVVLQDVNLAFEEGRLSGIMGPNGAGKTTCFHVLTGRYAPDRGRVRFAGEDITGLPPRRIAQKGISRSFQVMNLFNEYSALDNVLVALPSVRRQGFNVARDLGANRAAQDEAAAVLARVGLAGKEHAPAQGLSYGDRRALEIAVALAAAPRLLFLDEPTAGLGAEATERLADLVGRTEAAAHHRDHRARHALPVPPRRRRLGDPLGPGDRERHAGRAAREPVGAALEPRRARGMTPMLALERVRTFYGDTQVLFDVSLQVGRGEVVALLGANGAGKTTLLRSVLGLTPARSGRIEFNGRDVTHAPTHEIARMGLGWVPDDRRIFPTLTVARNLAIARKRTAFRAWRERDCFEIFSALEYLMHRECENLSGGEMQMVAISRALRRRARPGAVRRAEPGPCAEGRAGRDEDDRGA